MADSLYKRLGGYDAIVAVVTSLLSKLQNDASLRRFWDNRATDSVEREKQLLIDYICNAAGGEKYYAGRDMKTSHKGMNISTTDWGAFTGYLNATLAEFNVPSEEKNDVITFITSLQGEIVEA